MGAVGPRRMPPAAYRGKGRGFQTVSARSKRGPGRGPGYRWRGEAGRPLFSSHLQLTPPQGRAFNQRTRRVQSGQALDPPPGLERGAAAQSRLPPPPIRGPAGFRPALSAWGGPAGPPCPQLPSEPQPGPARVATPPRAPQGLRRPRRGEVWADVAPAEGGSPRVRMGEPGERKRGSGRSA